MSYIPLTDPFIVRFRKDNEDYEATVVYAKSDQCGTHFFDVSMQTPEGPSSFHLNEKRSSHPGAENIIWTDENSQVKQLYQVLGYEIEQYLRKNLGILLIDTPLTDLEFDHASDEGND